MASRNLPLLVFVALLSIAAPREAVACSCTGHGPPCEALWQTPVVFSGEVLDITPNPEQIAPTFLSQRRVRFRVDRAWRGALPAEVDVHTGQGGGDCGYPFTRGARYLVYAGTSGDRLTAGICSRTRLLSEADADLEYLQTAFRAGGVGRVFGHVQYQPDPDNHGRRPAPGYVVTLTPHSSAASAQRRVRTGPDGRYEFTNVLPGKYSIDVVLDSAERAYGPGTVELVDARGCASSDLFIAPNGRIAVRVVSASGEPARNFQVDLIDPESLAPGAFPRSQPLRTDGAGWARVDGLHPRRYVIGINVTRAPDRAQPYVRTFYPGVADAAWAQIIDLNYGEQVEIDPFVLPTPLPERALAGVVTWPNGSPAVGAWVSLQMRTRPQQPGEVIGRAVQTTTDGRFTMWAHLGRTYYVRAYVTHADGSYWSVDSAEFEVTSETPMLTLKLERAPRR